MTDAPFTDKSVSDLCAEIVSLQFRLNAALAEIDRLTKENEGLRARIFEGKWREAYLGPGRH